MQMHQDSSSSTFKVQVPCQGSFSCFFPRIGPGSWLLPLRHGAEVVPGGLSWGSLSRLSGQGLRFPPVCFETIAWAFLSSGPMYMLGLPTSVLTGTKELGPPLRSSVSSYLLGTSPNHIHPLVLHPAYVHVH